MSLSGTVFSHVDTSSQTSSNNSGRTYIQDIILDTYGHVTGITTATETVVNTNTNYYVSGITHTATGVTLNISGTTDRAINGATAALAGVVTTTAQTFAGAKTFNNDVTSSNFIETSDSRIKKELESPVLGMELIKLLEPKRYIKQDKEETGFYADQLPKEAEYIRKDIGEGLFGMAYMNLHAVEVKALQEHENEIQELKDKK